MRFRNSQDAIARLRRQGDVTVDKFGYPKCSCGAEGTIVELGACCVVMYWARLGGMWEIYNGKVRRPGPRIMRLVKR